MLARQVIAQVERWQAEARKLLGITFVHLSDEFYLLAEAPFPIAPAYDDFPQVDNGIGQTVRLRETWRAELERAVLDTSLPRSELTVLTGQAAVAAWRRELVPLLVAHGAPEPEVIAVENRFFGTSVTVAGLLSGRDVRRVLSNLPADPQRTVLLPPRLFNSDGLTLDDQDLATISNGLPHAVHAAPEQGFVDFWQEID